jgi:hypothetical protein
MSSHIIASLPTAKEARGLQAVALTQIAADETERMRRAHRANEKERLRNDEACVLSIQKAIKDGKLEARCSSNLSDPFRTLLTTKSYRIDKAWKDTWCEPGTCDHEFNIGGVLVQWNEK